MSLWAGGRFTDGPDDVLWAYSADPIDRRLLHVDVLGSIAHVTMLGSTGILEDAEAALLIDGLRAIESEALEGTFEFLDTDEDVHTAVERRLGELIGPLAGKLHTARSRNDQVSLDLRLYLIHATRSRVRRILGLIRALVDKAEEVGDTVVPSYTHLQQAQAVPLAHHLLAYAWMLTRDGMRFTSSVERTAMSPLGAGASGGSSLPIDPVASAAAAGLDPVFANSMDAVASRDFAAEYVWCCSQTMVHLSRLSEDLILWASSEFGWVSFGDAFTTGSSAMPQKKNPDLAELARGRSATVIGDLTAIMALQKGLPMTYNRDLQEDKRLVFHAHDTLGASLDALAALIDSASFTPPAPDRWVTALDLAEVLVSRGVPFREAHHVVGRLVADLVADDRG
ncbi:MAG: argininosuccinate lyase, partial [Acidimicrobiia bacterium]|nr:argininosuccinate lyase [Acidimicrobiia bacterium]